MINITINNKYFVRQMLKNDQFIKTRTKLLVKRISTDMRNVAKIYVPVSSARLRNSIRVYISNGGMSSEIKTAVPYAAYVEYGTGIYAANGNGRKTPWKYLNRDIWKVIYTRGQKPKFFMTKAFKSTVSVLDYIAKGVFK